MNVPENKQKLFLILASYFIFQLQLKVQYYQLNTFASNLPDFCQRRISFNNQIKMERKDKKFNHEKVSYSTLLFFRQYQFKLVMATNKQILLLFPLLMLVLSNSTPSNPTSGYYYDFNEGYSYKKGLTFQATIWPQEQNSFVGRMSCNGCDPQHGDTSCTQKLPITCIIHPKVLNRPFYNYYPDFTPYSNPDQSYYEGWTGGIIAVTDPVRGIQINSYVVGDNLCKTAFGPYAKFAEFTDGWFMSKMNSPNLAIEKAWDWGNASAGEYNFWGYFNHDHVGKSWVWTQKTPTGNCILPKSNPIP